MKAKTFSIKFIAYTGLMTALVYVCTLIGVTAGSNNFNIGDGAILICGALFNPLTAMIAGGLGAFLADLTTYPVAALYTLIIKAIEGLLAGVFFQLIYRYFDAIETPTKKQTAVKITLAGVNCIVCTMLMAGGYFLCKWLFYGTLETALASLLNHNIFQALVSTAIAMLALYVGKLEKMRPKTFLSFAQISNNSDVQTDVDEEQNETDVVNSDDNATDTDDLSAVDLSTDNATDNGTNIDSTEIEINEDWEVSDIDVDE